MNSRKYIIIALNMLYWLSTTPQQAQQKPTPSWDSLPNDVKRYLTPFIASSNVIEVAKTILTLNHTNKFFKNFINSKRGFISILEKMPYTANAIDLIDRLRYSAKKETDIVERLRKSEDILPILASQEVRDWKEAAQKRLVGAKELFEAIMEGYPTNRIEFEEKFKEGRPKKLGGNREKVKRLLKDKNIALNALNNTTEGFTPIIMAAMGGNEEIVAELLKAGANPDEQALRDGSSPLIASMSFKIDPVTIQNIVKQLLQAGANPNIPNDRRITPLMIAAETGYIEIFRMLLEAGANPLLKNLEGKRALDLATDEIQKIACDALIRK